MIKTFAGKETAALFAGLTVRRWPKAIHPAARRKMMQVLTASDVAELRIPPGNRLERLSGDREGQWSICINDQWRVCFRWHEGNAYDVEIVDYH